MVSMHNISERAVGGRVHGARLLDLTKMLSTVRGALLGAAIGFPGTLPLPIQVTDGPSKNYRWAGRSSERFWMDHLQCSMILF